MVNQEKHTDPANPVSEWAVILAGGDGSRLKPLTRKIAGDERPKQFCSIMGKTTLLEDTQRRSALEFAGARTLYVVNRLHERYYAPILADQPSHNLVIQPHNRGTAPAILYSLLRIMAVDPTAVVAFLPSDHYISDDEQFMEHIREGLGAARRRRDLVILLGLDPESPEVEYGWIEPANVLSGYAHIFTVRRFWEKPDHRTAGALLRRGCLWNSFVMIASVQALLELIESTLPHLYDAFACLSSSLGSAAEAGIIDRLYDQIEETNFSHQVLELRPERLAVLEVTGVRWNDLGEPKRVMASLDMAGVWPHWAETVVPQFA